MSNAQLAAFLEILARLIESQQASAEEAAAIVRAAKP